MAETADVVVVGGGPVGATLALRLAAAGRETVLLEPREPGAGLFRPVALAYGARLILERLDAWECLAPRTAICQIHVSQRAGFGRAMLSARDVRLPALGYVVDYARTHAALCGLLARRRGVRLLRAAAGRVVPGDDRARVEYSCDSSNGTIEARLAVVADGGAAHEEAQARTVDYHKTAIVATVIAERTQPNTAFERFTATGPLALLPCDDRYALIWSVTPERAQALHELPEAVFALELECEFGGRLGAFSAPTQRAAVPLVLRRAHARAGPRVVRIGNAAQTLHPVAGQGLNLGLRDAWELAAELERAPRCDPGSPALLAAYAARRRLDRAVSVRLTHALALGFLNDARALQGVRGAGVSLLGCLPPARDFAVRRMIFGFGA